MYPRITFSKSRKCHITYFFQPSKASLILSMAMAIGFRIVSDC